jgi:hypothetical protein
MMVRDTPTTSDDSHARVPRNGTDGLGPCSRAASEVVPEGTPDGLAQPNNGRTIWVATTITR